MFYKHRNLFVMFVMVAVIPATLGAALSKDVERFHETYTVEPGTNVNVYNINGNIEISKWDKDEVEVIAIKSTRAGKDELEKVKIEVKTNGDMEIRTIYLEKKAKVSVDYEIKVPDIVVVANVENSNGWIELKGTKGPSKLETSNGRIEVEDAEGDIDANTSNGRIEIEDVSGYIAARTSNGRINITGTAGISRVRTSNGRINVEIHNIKGDEVEIKTSNGSIDVYISTELDADIEMDTSNGIVKLHDIELADSEVKKTYVEGRLGKGGIRICIDTSNGSINLYKL